MSNSRPQAYQRLAELLIGSRIAMALRVVADHTRSAIMGKFMAGIYGPEGPKIAAGYPFGRFDTVIDIGGGQGHIVAAILQQHPELKGALLELPPTAEVARHFLAGQGLLQRWDVLAGRGRFFSLGAGRL